MPNTRELAARADHRISFGATEGHAACGAWRKGKRPKAFAERLLP
jgi:hypothetical protein